jgi:plastocyanin
MNSLDSSPVAAAVRRPIAKAAAALSVVAAAALLAACGSGSGGGGATASAPAPTSTPGSASASASAITIKDFKFAPATLTVRPGARIAVTNEDSAPHTVTADDGHSFDTGTLQQGSSKTITAPSTGSFAFHCTVHPFMKGQLVVK